MQGFKTILGLILTSVVAPTLVARGFPALNPEQTTAAVAATVGSVGVALRFVTDGPVFQSLRTWLAARKTPTAQEIAAAMSDAALAEIASRKAAKEGKS